MLFRSNISKSLIPYVANYTAEYIYEADNIKLLLKNQISGAVKFEQSIRGMLEKGIDTFIEIGPGKTLSGFVKKISAEAAIYNIETIEDLDKVCKQLQ